MDIDAIRHQLSDIEQEIANIIQEMNHTQRDSVRNFLRQELEEKEKQRAIFANQINMGENNNFSNGNINLGSNVGHDLNQNNESNTVNINGDINGNNYIAGRDLHIHSDNHMSKNIVPIDVNISCHTTVFKEVKIHNSAIGIWKIKKTFTSTEDIWEDNAPFEVIAEVKNSITLETQKSVLFNGLMHLKSTVYRYSDNGPNHTVSSKEYIVDRGILREAYNNILRFLNDISKDGYNSDDEIIRINKLLDDSNHTWSFMVYRESYYDHGWVAGVNSVDQKRNIPVFRGDAGVWILNISSITLRKR